jgi:hypothetical protein
VPTAPTASVATNTTQIATTAFVQAATIAPSNLTGPITSVGAATSIASQTGTGTKFVVDTSPTLVTPVLGVATATSINGTTIPASKTLVATDSTTYVVPSQSGNSGKFLTTNGTASSWGAISGSTADPTEPSSPTDGLIWIDTDGTAPTTVVTRWSKSPTNGTTTLSGTDDTTNVLAYTPGYEQVFLNGVLLSRGSDYTATTGTSVVLTVATVTSDIVEIIAALQVAYTDAITTTAAASTYIAKTITTTKGDLISATGANTPARLAVGANNTILMADSAEATGLKYAGTYTDFTPTITAGTGSFTTVSAVSRYLRIGNLVHWYGKVSITTAGTAAGGIVLTIPVAKYAGANQLGYGEETAAVGFPCTLLIAGATATILKTDYTTAIASGRAVDFNITYEVA